MGGWSWILHGHAFTGTRQSNNERYNDMTARQQLVHAAKQMGHRSWSAAKTFAVMGFVFSAAECVVEKARAKHDITNTVVAVCVTGGAISAKGLKAPCVFCQISRSSTVTPLLHSDEKVVAFRDINPSAFRHYLVIPVKHIATFKDLQMRTEDSSLVSHMLNVGQMLLGQDAPESQYRFGFHQPPFNSVDHLHLHCFALPFTPKWKHVKYISLGPLGIIEANKLLEKIKPLSPNHSRE